jgi:conjugative transfer signal peptidase TraF
MNPRRAITFAMGLAALGALAVSARTAPGLVWNTTASAPTGLYWLGPESAIRVGDLVAIRPPGEPAAWMDRRGYLPSGALLIKQVAAMAPSRVCRLDARVTIDGVVRAVADDVDRRGRPLPQWSGCRVLSRSEVFALNAAPRSLDGRYLGPLPRAAVVGQLRPLLLSGSPADGE